LNRTAGNGGRGHTAMNSFPVNLFVLFFTLLGLAACSSVNLDKVLPDKQVEYKREVVADKHLEVPPDLTSSRIDNRIPGLEGGGSASYTDYTRARQGGVGAGISRTPSRVLPQRPDIRVVRDGQDRWLVVKGSPDQVWDRVVDFWQENGILLDELDPQAGVMQTSWLENRADIANDPITDFIRKAFDGLYGAATRDRFRVRIEEGEEPGTTEIYLTHFGMEQDFATSGATADEEQIYWKIRPRDPGLEATMLRKLLVYLGYAEQEAKSKLAAAKEFKGIRSRMDKGSDRLGLIIETSFSRGWRVLGLALDRVGFVVEDRNRSTGTYYVRYRDPTAGSKQGGWLSKLAFWRSEKPAEEEKLYLVRLESEGEGSRVTVHDEEGRLLTGETALRILTMVQEQLN